MTDEQPPETEWLTVSFDFKIVGAEVSMPDYEARRDLLRGLGQAVAYLLMPESDFAGVKVYASRLSLKPTDLFTDEMLGQIMDKWKGEDP